MHYRLLYLLALSGLLSACGGASATATPAPTLTSAPATGTPVPDIRTFTILSSSIINYTATLTLGGIQIDGTFGINGKTIKLVPEAGGFRVQIDVQIDGNAVTGANDLVVNALKSNMETDKFPYGHFIATSKEVVKPDSAPMAITASGTLELHGQTRPFDLPITFTVDGGTLAATGITTLDLTDYGVNVPTAIMKSVITFKVHLTAQETPSK